MSHSEECSLLVPCDFCEENTRLRAELERAKSLNEPAYEGLRMAGEVQGQYRRERDEARAEVERLKALLNADPEHATPSERGILVYRRGWWREQEKHDETKAQLSTLQAERDDWKAKYVKLEEETCDWVPPHTQCTKCWYAMVLARRKDKPEGP